MSAKTNTIEVPYDWIHLADNEWGNGLMLEVAEKHFEENPEIDYVLVYEHAGWHLGYKRDGGCWCTANYSAVCPGPYPTTLRQVVHRQDMVNQMEMVCA